MQKFLIKTPVKAYQFLMQELHLKMPKAQQLINKGRVFYEGKALENHQKAKILEKSVEVLVFVADYKGLKPLFENADFAIFNKPSKMLIHPKGRFTHHSFIDEITHLYGKEAHLAHRIDRETSGLVLVGRHKESVSNFGKMFLENSISKHYLALVRGKIERSFSLTLPLATQQKGGDLCVRSIIKDINYIQEDLHFKDAKTSFEPLGFLKQDGKIYTLLKVAPLTGRTHQIRLHLDALGHCILGDPLYGAEDTHSREYLDSSFIRDSKICDLSAQKRLEYFGAERLMLHAYSLEFYYKNKHYYFQSIENFDIKGNML